MPDPEVSPPAGEPLAGPRVRTPVPGPLSAAYLTRQAERESNARTYPRRLPIAIQRASGPFVQDVDGNVFLDFLTGAGVLSLGHSHPAVVAAVRAQLETFVHGLDLPTPAKDRFTELQLEMLPEPMRGRMLIHFCGPTGANGVEAAIKLCRLATGRNGIVSFRGGFHGSSAVTMSVSGDTGTSRDIPAPAIEASFFPYSYCARCPLGLAPQTCSVNCAHLLRTALEDGHSGLRRPAAVVRPVSSWRSAAAPTACSGCCRPWTSPPSWSTRPS